MFTMFKSLTALAVLAGGTLVAQPAKADNFSFGIGFSAPVARPYRPAPVYYQPAYVPQVSYYSSPSYTYSSYNYSQAYCPPTPVVYSQPVIYAPAPVYYQTPVYYSTPAYCPPVYYSRPVYYSQPSLSFNFGFGSGGGHRR